MTYKLNSELNFQNIFLLLSILSIGLFHEFLSCAAAVLLCLYLSIIPAKNGGIAFKVNFTSISIIIISIFYGISTFWSIDSGMAVIGFVKFLPLPLFMLSVMQRKEDSTEYLDIIPAAAVFMTIVSAVLSFIPRLSRIFAPAERLAGFLEYSNTYALLMLIAAIITVTKEKLKITDYIFIPILIFGIILSGSRTVFILTIIAAIAILFFSKNKRAKIFLFVFVFATVAFSASYAFLTNDFDSIGRFLTTSFSESTFLGRLLYYYDALPVILRNPFGTGYQGYYYLQTSIQSGLYTVRYIHNDFLQLMLDIGWIPTVFFIIAIIRSFFKKETSMKKRLLLFAVSAHCFFDFDLQFVAVFMILILLLDFQCGKEFKFKTSSCVTALSLTGCLAVYMGISLTAAFFNNYELSSKIYPWNTDVNTAILYQDTDAGSMERDADKILSQNKYVTAAYSAKAEAAYSAGDFAAMMEYKDKAIENAPLFYEEYEDYIYKLLTGIELYNQYGDTYSADYCRGKLNDILNKFYSIKGRLSYLGTKINDQPVTELPPELVSLIEQYKIPDDNSIK